MSQYLGREKVPFDPDVSQFAPLDPGMYLIKIEEVRRSTRDTKYGKAKILNPQCRVIMGDMKGKVVFGTVWIYTADDNPQPRFFADKMWINNGYFNFIRATEAINETALELMIDGKEMPLLNDDDLKEKTCFVVVTHEQYWKNEIPEDERTDENATIKAVVQNWVSKETGALALQTDIDTINSIVAAEAEVPF
jgi:hypothetical protein